MSLADKLSELTAPGTTVPPIVGAPAGWEPGIKFEPDGSRIVTLPPSPEIPSEDGWPEAVAALGVKVPDGYRIRLVEAKYDPAAWQRDSQGEDAVTRPVWRYRFVVEPAPAKIDVTELLQSIRKRTTSRKSANADKTADVCERRQATFVYAFGDTQWGKPDGDGAEGTVDRWYASLDRALTRYQTLRKRNLCGPVTLLVAGDCIEGTQSQGGRLVGRLQLSLTEQVRLYRRTLADAVAAFAALERVHVAVVPGNHDEALRIGDQMAGRYDDSWAIEGASQVADVMNAKGYDVDWTFPGKDGLHVTVDCAGTRIGLFHGHQTKGKTQAWLSAKAMDRDAIGTCDVAVSGHYHHLRVEQMGKTTHMQVGALDGGSTWFEHRGGLSAPPAALTFLTEGGRWHGLEIV